MIKIAIFASGSGSNAQEIMQRFAQHTTIQVAAIFTNNKNAGVIERAKKYNVPVVVFDRNMFTSHEVLDILKKLQIDWVILAGFLWQVPEHFIAAFPNKIMNLHPALLPNYGGKGMYGMNVHKAVIAAKEKQSGITIHFVNAHYDEGKIIAQFTCNITPTDTPESLVQKIHELEHTHFPATIEKVILK